MSTRIDEGVQVGITDNIRIAGYDVSNAVPGWHDLQRNQRHAILRNLPPDWVETVSNTTVDGLHEYIPALLNGRNTITDVQDDPAELAFGDDWGGGTTADSTVFTTGDTALNNEVGRIGITDPDNQGREWRCDEYVSSLELNGYTLREIGVYSAGGTLYNHAPLSSEIPKTDQLALLVGVSITFDAA